MKVQDAIENMLERGIHCPDGKVRKYFIGYNAEFDGVEIQSKEHYEYGDNDDAGNAMRDAIIDLCRGKEIYTAKISDGLKDPAEMQVQEIVDSINNKTHNI